MRVKKARLHMGLKVAICVLALGILWGDRAIVAQPSSMMPTPIEPAFNPDDWQSLARAVSLRSRQFPGAVGYVIKDLRSGQVMEANTSKIFPILFLR